MNPNKTKLLTIAVATALSSQVALAEQITQTADENIIVTASRYERSVDEVLASVAVIDRSDIEKIQPLSVADLLQTVAGVDIAKQGGQGQETSSFTRGTNSSHTLILVDGVRVGSATLGGTSLANIPTEQIERIEVVKGPRASLYGSDAIGGVVQIFTRQLSGGEYGASVELGSDSFKKASVYAGISHGNGSTTFSLSAEENDGYDVYAAAEADEDGYDRVNVAVKGEQKLNENWQLGWVGRYDDGGTEFDDTFGGEYINEQEFTNHVIQGTLDYSSDAWQHNFLLSQSRDSSVSFGTNLPKADADKFETRRHQFSYVGNYQVNNQLSVIMGGDFYRDEITTKTAYAEDERDVIAGFIGGLYEHGALITEATVRYDDVENIDSESTYNLSSGYHLTDTVFAGFNLGTGFKAPSFNDLYYPWGGNPDLVSETSDSIEFLVKADLFGYKTEVSVYQTDIEDLIEWAPLEDNPFVWMPQNVDDAEIDGAEISIEKAVDNFSTNFFYSYVDAKDANTNERLSRRARHTANLAMSYTLNDWAFAANYGHHGSRYDGGVKLENYNLVDLSVNYQINSDWQVQVKANNVFDEDYQNVNNYVAPGAEYFIKLTYSNF